MGGLVVHPNNPAPYYEFEMLNIARSIPDVDGGGASGVAPTLFLHYKVVGVVDANRMNDSVSFL